MKSYNFKIKNPIELQDIIKNSNLKDSEQLLIQAFVGNISKSYIIELQKELQKYFKKAHIIGSTAYGSIANAKVIDKPYATINFSYFKDTKLLSYSIGDEVDEYNTGIDIGEYFNDFNPKLIIAFGNGLNTNGELLLDGINSILNNTIIAGGLASKDEESSDTFIFNHSLISSNKVIAVGLSNPNLNIIDNYALDWIPIGRAKLVTKSIDNRVYSIDNISAVDFYSKYLGEKVANNLSNIGMQFPLIVNRGKDSVCRALMKQHSDKSLSFAGNLKEGELVQFAIGDIDTIIKNSNDYKNELPYSNIESIFIYSCITRRYFLQDDISIELEALEKIAPTTGFFTFGEFYNQSLLNQSNRYIALSEKPLKSIEVDNNLIMNSKNNSTFKALVNLTNTISSELEEFRKLQHLKIEEQKNDIYRKVYYDEYTNLPNRLRLFHKIRHHKDRYLIYFDVDRFSKVNYFYGFQAGDELIINLKRYLNSVIKNIGILYKLPADEFATIITQDDINIREFIATISKRLTMMVFKYKEILIPYTVTMGISKIEGDGVAIRYAEISVNNARLLHKPYIFYSDIAQDNKQKIKDTTQMALIVRDAIINNKLVMYYQPIYDIKTDKIYTYESLARFKISDNKILTPDKFLPILPHIYLSNSFVKMVIETTFKKFANKGIRFSINMTIDDIVNREINDFLYQKLEEYNVYKQLTIEILETIEIVESKEITNFINKIRKLGVKIAIDDFGSGFANFEYLAKIKADILKIDGSLIKNIDKDENSKIIVETIVIFAKKLGIKTVAEYIHSKEIFDIIKDIGVDYAQGFYLAKGNPELLS
ncbi:diguanylate cyclase/phosphodiesterase (GGDEF & EAL domains) with PAS/PAC sensor(s) [hydrothermal vent metagenome]|uniref:Diguanylate cyclase/phosphodiesterase (GGDEF & EAL domains) with PAS/PAC sensor(S) n=1 Tax=hydrothermal vent metagenome TaxID=652676 RepID=A0A1W1EK30_9ZZZZ